MSADNGIYILVTKETVGLRYRVAHCQAIEDIHFVPPGRYCPKGQRFVNLPALWRRFKDSEVFRTDISAYAEARKKEAQETICEYGISHIELDRPFPDGDNEKSEDRSQESGVRIQNTEYRIQEEEPGAGSF